jgi:hypothetical protein
MRRKRFPPAQNILRAQINKVNNEGVYVEINVDIYCKSILNNAFYQYKTCIET